MAEGMAEEVTVAAVRTAEGMAEGMAEEVLRRKEHRRRFLPYILIFPPGSTRELRVQV